ncbi:MAG: O-antigen ligase family protein [Pseudomonadota bacterium]|nr:O-antigen ligase family protein [Pseudomonadota bacterium]
MSTREAPQQADTPLRFLLAAALFLFILPTNHTMAPRMIFLFAALVTAVVALRKYGMPRVPIRWPLFAWASLALLSLVWSEMPEFSWAEFKKEVVFGMAAFFSFFVLTRGRRELHLWIHIAVAALATTMFIGLYDYWKYYGQPEPWNVVHGYASYSTYLVTVASLLALWFTIVGRRLRAAGLVLVAVYLWVAYLLGNRMFWLSLTGVLVVVTALYVWRWRHERARLRQSLIPLIAGIVLCGGLFVLTANQKPVDYTHTARDRDASVSQHLVGTFTQSERLYMWAFWVERIKERPWTGVGFGRDLPHWVYEKPKEWPNLYFAHAHNLVLDYGAQLGIPGIIVLFWLFGAIAARFWRYTRSPDETLFLVGVTGLSLVLAFFSKNLTDELFWRTDALVFWSFTGILLGYGEHRTKEL